ncbi:MAG TPA: nitroreductase [Syntrophorhabdales bacterium]|nr:nitroreductase [Syntrophorhabdales bacterium]
MDVEDAIMQRRSIRAFKPDGVPKEKLRNILEQALRAPSWANTQPWEFVVVTGERLHEIQKAYLKRGEHEPQSEIARPYEFPEPYLSRREGLTPQGTTQTPEYMEYRRVQNFKNYGAPVVIYVLIDRCIFHQSKGTNVWSVYDCGSVVQNIMLLATSYGLGTIAQAQSVIYPDLIRKVVDIPESKLIALGIAIGYPDWENPVNQRSSQRESLGSITRWYGFA